MVESERNGEKDIIGTEQNALEKEIEEDLWQKEYGEKLPYVIDQMNVLLANGSDEALARLKSMFLPGIILDKYKQTDVFANMYVIMAIYEIELERGIAPNILSKGKNVDELVDYLFRLRMILYRLDFEISSGTKEEFLSFLKQNKTSMVTIEIMLNTSVMRPLNVALKLEQIFWETSLKDYEIFILLFIENYWKGNYRILQKLHLYGLISGDFAIKGIAEEDKDTVMQLQELMWKLFYKDFESEREIAAYLKSHWIKDDLWMFLLGLDGVKEVEYYLLIVNALLEEGILDKAEMVLEFLIKEKPEYESASYLLSQIREKSCKMENGI